MKATLENTLIYSFLKNSKGFEKSPTSFLQKALSTVFYMLSLFTRIVDSQRAFVVLGKYMKKALPHQFLFLFFFR